MQYTQGKTLKINQKIALARWWGIRLDNEKNKKKISGQKNSSGVEFVSIEFWGAVF